MVTHSSPTSHERETLVTSYFRHLEQKSAADIWAWTRVYEIASGPSAEAGWDLVVELVRRVPDAEFGQVAAGPLEELLKTHGQALVEWIEGESRRNARFKEALGRIWLRAGTFPPSVEARIVAASGGRLALL